MGETVDEHESATGSYWLNLVGDTGIPTQRVSFERGGEKMKICAPGHIGVPKF